MNQTATNQQRRPARGSPRREDDGPHDDSGRSDAAITRTALGDEAIARTGETAATASATRETAMIQARIVQAMQRPRRFEEVRERFKADCERPTFAKVARFHKPQGWVMDPDTNKPVLVDGQKVRNFVKGWSIRAIESALRALRNIDCRDVTTFEDERVMTVDCQVWDLETNERWSAEVRVPKTVERRYLRDGQKPLGSRVNSYGDTVYLFPATDDELRMTRARLVSMTMRKLGERIIPGDLLDEFLEPVEALRAKAIEAERAGVLADPLQAMRALVDKLAAIGVRAADVVDYLGGRSIKDASPEQILELRIIGADIVAGNYSWRDALAGSPYREQVEGAGEEPEDERAKEAREKIKAKLAEQQAKRAKPAAPPTMPTEPPAAPAPAPAPPPAVAPAPPGRQPGED